MKTMEELIHHFRNAIDIAKENDEFVNIQPFAIFPKGCCDVTCDLLGHYLLTYGIETYQVNGQFWSDKDGYSLNHVWLLTTDGIVIDITGDQFKNDSTYFNYSKRVHIGEEDNLHRLFIERRFEEENTTLDGEPNVRRNMLNQAYQKILKYI